MQIILTASENRKRKIAKAQSLSKLVFEVSAKKTYQKNIYVYSHFSLCNETLKNWKHQVTAAAHEHIIVSVDLRCIYDTLIVIILKLTIILAVVIVMCTMVYHIIG